MEKPRELVYICNPCDRVFNPDTLPDEEYFDEEDNWIHPCPICRKPLNWGFR